MNYFGEFNDFYDNFDVPSGDDVTELFAAAGQGTLALRRMIRCTLTQRLDMEPEEVILMDGFGLADAMSVFEVCRALSSEDMQPLTSILVNRSESLV